MRQPKVGVFLAAGRGKRLRPYTDTVPKPLLSVNGRPTLDFVLTAAAAAGLTQVCLVTHYLGAQIATYVGTGATWGLTLRTVHQPALLGSAHGLLTAVQAIPDWLDDEKPILVSATDYLMPRVFLADLVQAHGRNNADITVSLKEMNEAEIRSRSNVQLSEDERILEIREKPEAGDITSNIAASLSYILPADIDSYLRRMSLSPRGEYELPAVVNRMIADNYTARGLLQATPLEWQPPTPTRT